MTGDTQGKHAHEWEEELKRQAGEVRRGRQLGSSHMAVVLASRTRGAFVKEGFDTSWLSEEVCPKGRTSLRHYSR